MNSNASDAKTKTATACPSAGSASEAPARPSANIPPPEIADYELIKRVGKGSYGEVWLARNVMGTYRALKIVYRDAFQSDRPFEREFDGIKRFEPVSQTQESQLKILHVGRRTDYFYYVMELADDATVGADVRRLTSDRAEEGQSLLTSAATYSPKTLRSEIQQRGRLPMEECLEISLKLTQALSHLHRCGLVHRDIKPSNIIFVNGLPKLADIGLVADTEGTLSFVGTEGYLPPEGPGKPPADIFSLGKVLYEISTGRDRNEFPELPTAWTAASECDVFAEFNEVIIKACAADLSQRYQTAEEMHEDLLLVRTGKSLRRLRRAERRARELIRAAAVLTVLAVLIGAGFLYQRRQTTIVAALAKRESSQRQRAEDALTTVELVRTSDMLERGDASTALMHLARTLRNAPANRFAAERLMATINQRNFLLPLHGPLQHRNQIHSACFSPDGRWIATASKDLTARIWRVSTGEPLTEPLLHDGEVVSIRFSPDSRQVVTASKDGMATVWDVNSGQTGGVLLEHESEVDYAEFSPDGQHILTVSGEIARVWEARTGHLVGDVMRHEIPPFNPMLPAALQGGAITDAHFSPDGIRVATASKDGTARVWDAATGKPLTAPLRHKSQGVFAPAVNSVRFSPDSQRLITSSWDNTARVWDTRTGDSLVEPLKHEYPVRFAQFSPDGRKVVTGSHDRTARIWDAFTGKPLTDGLAHPERVCHAAFSPDGKWLITAEEHDWRGVRDIVRLWDADNGVLVAEAPQSGKVYAIDFSPDGQRVLTASDRSLWLWDALPSAISVPVLTHSNWVGFADFSPDGSRLVTAERAELSTPQHSNSDRTKTEPSCAAWVWNARTGKRIAGPLQHESGITSAQFSSDGNRVVTASHDQTVRVWDAATGHPLTDPLEHAQVVRFTRFTPDGQKVITSCWLDRAWLWDASTGKMLLEFHDSGPGEGSNPNMPVRSEDLSPDGRWLVTCSRDGARVWDVSNGKFMKGPFASGENIRAARFSPDGTRIITASFNHQACVWDIQTGELVTGPLRHNWIVLFAAFSPDGRKVVTCSHDGTAQIWDAWTGQPLTKPLRHKGEVVYAEFSPDGRRLVTASWWDKAALLWDAETGLPLSRPLQHDDWVTYATFSPDGRWIVTTGKDRKARVWEIPLAQSPVPDWLPNLAEAIVGKRLNAEGIPEAVAIEELIVHKQRLSASNETDDYTRWAKWFFANRAERTISAFSEVTVADYTTKLVEENTLASLTEAVSLAPTNAVALARLARHVLEDSSKEKSHRVAEAHFYSRHAASLSPDDPEVQRLQRELSGAELMK